MRIYPGPVEGPGRLCGDPGEMPLGPRTALEIEVYSPFEREACRFDEPVSAARTSR